MQQKWIVTLARAKEGIGRCNGGYLCEGRASCQEGRISFRGQTCAASAFAWRPEWMRLAESGYQRRAEWYIN